MKPIPFSPPDIIPADIDAVADVLRSGWITTGPKTKEFERDIAVYCGAERAVCLSSATAGLELCLRILGIGPGDEVITTPYTYAATANVILHTGAKPVFADIRRDTFEIDSDAVARAVSKRTKAVIPVDFGGWPCDYDSLFAVLNAKKRLYRPRRGTLQTRFERCPVIADAAHSFGSNYHGIMTGSVADMTVFSFHAVKNLTTAEGGAVTFGSLPDFPAEKLYHRFQLLSLHGQNKDALEKMQKGSWKYSVDLPGYKYNMTDMQAALGLSQLKRYEKEILPGRERVCSAYDAAFSGDERVIIPPFRGPGRKWCWHLYPLRLRGAEEDERDRIITEMASQGISLNVHFIPVVLHPAYRERGYSIRTCPNAYTMYRNEISLPVYPGLPGEDAQRVVSSLKRLLD